MKIICVIPARYASTRLPGKPLKDICGKPMICRVFERAKLAKNISDVIVATDDARKQKSKGKIKSKVVPSSVPAIEQIEIPLPSLEVQERIVNVLDNFEAICFDRI